MQHLKEIAQNFKGKVIYPVHLNPNVQKPVRELLGDIDNAKGWIALRQVRNTLLHDYPFYEET